MVLHDALMRSATGAKVQVTTASRLSPGALRHTAALMWPRLEEQRGAARRKQLLEGLQVEGGWRGGQGGEVLGKVAERDEVGWREHKREGDAGQWQGQGDSYMVMDKLHPSFNRTESCMCHIIIHLPRRQQIFQKLQVRAGGVVLGPCKRVAREGGRET